jgi:hypothetical protein
MVRVSNQGSLKENAKIVTITLQSWIHNIYGINLVFQAWPYEGVHFLVNPSKTEILSRRLIPI